MTSRKTLLLAFSFLSASALLSSCGIFIGNVRPVSERDETYRYLDLSKEKGSWILLPAGEGRPGEVSATEVSDIAFQSKKTGSTISLTSGCRPSNVRQDDSLEPFMDPLLIGITEITRRDNAQFEIQGLPALQSTIQGKAEGGEIAIRAVVLRKASCVYDATYIALPRFFDAEVADFDRFVKSLRLR